MSIPRFTSQQELETFIFTMIHVLPQELIPHKILLTKEELKLIKGNEFYGPTGTIKLVEREEFLLERKYKSRLDVLESKINGLLLREGK